MKDDDPGKQAVGPQIVADMRRLLHGALTAEGVVGDQTLDGAKLISTAEGAEIVSMLTYNSVSLKIRMARALALFSVAATEVFTHATALSLLSGVDVNEILRDGVHKSIGVVLPSRN